MFLLLLTLSCSEDILGRPLVRRHLLGRLWTVEATLMTSWGLWTVLLSTYTPSLVSFCFCCCLILFKCDNKGECVYAFTEMFLCADCTLEKDA